MPLFALHPHTLTQALPLWGVAGTRQREQAAMAQLPPHRLMQDAGLAVARLALALAPHARTVWLACGPGNNGGDGLEAASHLQRWGLHPVVTWLGQADTCPADTRTAWAQAQAAGVVFAEQPPTDLGPQDLCIDALLGLGASRAPTGTLALWIQALNTSPAPVLAVDLPTGLQADTGQISARPSPPNATFSVANNINGTRDSDQNNEKNGLAVRADHTLSLLNLKPGLFTALGRDLAGQVWLDDLGTDRLHLGTVPAASAWLAPSPAPLPWPHASHKGSRGDVAVLGGAPGMHGAAWLAGLAALHAGAGRTLVALLDPAGSPAPCPDLMTRAPQDLPLDRLSLVCGCGGGQAVAGHLPTVMAKAAQLVLDADALNALASHKTLQNGLRARHSRGQPTVITPHPLEAARLLGCHTADVQADRLAAARRLSTQLMVTVVLKGSGTVVCCPDSPAWINPTGNARLAVGGTGDVLAGLIGARLAQGLPAPEAARHAVWQHGALADHWPTSQALTASALARALT